jgi:predicted transcriptional regulator
VHIGKTVTVLAAFDPSYRLKPLRFRWSGRFIKVEEITYIWKSKEGNRIIYHFSLTDGNALYELSFDNESLIWKLENLEA